MTTPRTNALLWPALLAPLLLAAIWFGIRPAWRETSADFTGYYTAGRAWNPGPLHDFQPRHIYDPGRFQELAIVSGVPHPVYFAYQTPFCAAFFRGLALFEWDTARRIWLFLNLLFLVCLIFQVMRLNRTREPEQPPDEAQPPRTLPAWVWPAAALLLIGPPLWNHLRTGQLYLLTALLILLSWPASDGLSGKGSTKFWLGDLAFGLALALKPIWILALPFRFLARLGEGRQHSLLTAIMETILIGLLAALFQLTAGWHMIEAAYASFTHLWEGNIMGKLLFQNQSGAILTSFLAAGYADGSWGARLSAIWGLAFRWLPLALALLILLRNPKHRVSGGAVLAFLIVCHIMPSVASYHLVLVAVGVSLLPGLSNQRVSGHLFLLALLIPLGYLPATYLQDLAYSMPGPAMLRVWCLALILMLTLLPFSRAPQLAEPSGRGFVWRSRLAYFWFWGAFLTAVFLSLAGDRYARQTARERERLHEKGFALSMAKNNEVRVVAGLTVPQPERQPYVPGVIRTAFLNRWGAPFLLTPVYLAPLPEGATHSRVLFRMVDSAGIRALGASLPLEGAPRLRVVNPDAVAHMLNVVEPGAAPRAGDPLLPVPLKLHAEDAAAPGAAFIAEGIQPWPVGLTPDTTTGSWVPGSWETPQKLALDDNWSLVAEDEGWGYGLNQFKVIRNP